MEDSFVEKYVKRDQGKEGIAFIVCSVIALLIFMVFLNGIPILFGYNIIYFTGMISFLLCYLLYRLITGLNVEYGIEITNDLFEGSKVTNHKKTELLASFSLRNSEYIGPVTSDRFINDLEEASFTLNFTALRKYAITSDNWYIIVNAEGEKYIVIFEFDEQMYPVFRRYNPRGTSII